MLALRKPTTVTMPNDTSKAANAVSIGKPRLSNLATYAPVATDPWLAATQSKRDVAQARLDALGTGVHYVNEGASVNSVAEMLATKYEVNNLTPLQIAAITVLKKVPSLPTLKRWLSAYKQDGRVGLLPNHTGRVRKDYGWEARAVELYNLPSKPDAGGVAMALQREGFAKVTHGRVRDYLNTLSALYTSNSPKRMGEHLHRLNQQAYQQRDKESWPTGNVYAGDGHTIDCYLAHHITGKPTRYELTLFIDIRSLHVAGWYLSESESAMGTMFALSKAMVNHDHIPTFIYIDRGSGWRAKMLNDKTTGWYQSLGISVIAALPRNPHGKSWVERFFREIRDKHDKFFADGLVYCGHDMANEVINKVHGEARTGKRVLPSIYQYTDSLNEWIAQHHQRPSAALNGQSPVEVWGGFERFPVGDAADVLHRPSIQKRVRRSMIFMHKRVYFHEDLAHYQDRKTWLIVEFDVHDDRCVWVYTPDKRLICVALLTTKAIGLSSSRVEEANANKTAKALQRAQNKVDEIAARGSSVVDMDAVADHIEMNDGIDLLSPASPYTRKTKPIIIDIDVD